MKNGIEVRFHLKEKEVTIEGKRYTIKELEDKAPKTKFEVSILVTLYRLFGKPIVQQTKLEL